MDFLKIPFDWLFLCLSIILLTTNTNELQNGLLSIYFLF